MKERIMKAFHSIFRSFKQVLFVSFFIPVSGYANEKHYFWPTENIYLSVQASDQLCSIEAHTIDGRPINLHFMIHNVDTKVEKIEVYSGENLLHSYSIPANTPKKIAFLCEEQSQVFHSNLLRKNYAQLIDTTQLFKDWAKKQKESLLLDTAVPKINTLLYSRVKNERVLLGAGLQLSWSPEEQVVYLSSVKFNRDRHTQKLHNCMTTLEDRMVYDRKTRKAFMSGYHPDKRGAAFRDEVIMVNSCFDSIQKSGAKKSITMKDKAYLVPVKDVIKQVGWEHIREYIPNGEYTVNWEHIARWLPIVNSLFNKPVSPTLYDYTQETLAQHYTASCTSELPVIHALFCSLPAQLLKIKAIINPNHLRLILNYFTNSKM